MARTVELSPIVPGGGGRDDYSGPLLSDVRFGDFSHSALVRIAEEVCSSSTCSHSFLIGVRKRTDEASASTLLRKQLTGIAGLTSERLRNALGLSGTFDDLATILGIHPVLAPYQYVGRTIENRDDHLRLRIGRGSGVDIDGGWTTFIDATTSGHSMRSSAGSTRTSRRGR